MVNKIWITFFLMLAGMAGWQANEMQDSQDLENTVTTCPGNIILAYTDTDKYICECVGYECPCIDTDEILSELG